ncbi:MAG: transposase [Microgenomates group bacterium]
MTAKNRTKTYVDNTRYHVYNRGVEKRTIFLDDKDYKVFLSYLQFYLMPIPSLRGPSPKSYPSQQLSNHNQKIRLIAYCLMPNHFHLLIKQTNKNDMTEFLRAISTRYSMYFNKRYDRVGSLFQGRYKAVLIDNEMQFLYLTKYIHRNPLDLFPLSPDKILDYPYSSYRNFLGIIHQSWVDPSDIIYSYSKNSPRNTYQNFVEESREKSTEIETLGNLTLDWTT